MGTDIFMLAQHKAGDEWVEVPNTSPFTNYDVPLFDQLVDQSRDLEGDWPQAKPGDPCITEWHSIEFRDSWDVGQEGNSLHPEIWNAWLDNIKRAARSACICTANVRLVFGFDQ